MIIKINDETKRQFIKDYELPSQVVQEPYFSYFLELYEEDYKSRTRYDLLIKTVENLGGLKEFISASRKAREQAIDFIADQHGYKELVNDKLEHLNSSTFSRKENLYNQDNVGKTFVSIDLVKANVQALNFYDKSILDDSENYKDFISKFTDLEYLINSKQIRQVIFGSVSPKKQQKIQKFIMGLVRDSLVRIGLNPDDIKASSPDELVFEHCHLENFESFVDDETLSDFKFHVDVFELENIRSDIPTLIKRFKNKDGFEIKKGNNKHMAEIIKHVKGIELHPFDFVFFDEGRIATYSKRLI